MKRSAPGLASLAGLVAILLVAACAGGGSAAPTPGPTSTPDPSPGAARTVPELKLALIEELGALWYCDPDFYPVQRENEADAARERWPEVVADAAAFAVLTAVFDVDPAEITDAQKLDVYRAWKVLNAIALDPIGNDRYRFDYLAQPPAGGGRSGTRTTGTIDTGGTVGIEQQAEAGEPICPICLARGTGIDTPAGRVAVELLRIGDAVWTLGRDGIRVRGEVIATGSTAAPAGHRVVRLVLADGRAVTASAGHPLGDGRALRDLRVGDPVDGSAVVSAHVVAYADNRTFDIVVSGEAGIYLVDRIPMGSTLRP